MSQFFASGSQSIGVSASASVLPMNIHPKANMICFRMDWLDLLAVQGTLKSKFQHHSSKASILWHSAFFIVQLSQSYMTTAKTIALTTQTFAGKAMSLLFNMLSESESEVAQSYPALCNPMDCSLPGSSLHGILQARVLEWVAISFSRGSSRPRDQTRVSCIPGGFFTI